MKLSANRLSLIALIGVGLAVIAGSARWAWQVEEVGVGRDRSETEAYAELVSDELDRTQRRAEAHYRRLIQLFRKGDTFATKAEGRRLVGVESVAWLDEEQSELVAIVEGAVVPVVAQEFSEELGEGAGEWIEVVGGLKAVYVMNTGRGRIAAVTVNVSEVRKSLLGHFSESLEESWQLVAAAGGADAFLAPDGEVLRGGVEQRESDLHWEFPTTFGVWRISSWDEIERKGHLDWIVFGMGCFLAGSIVGGGWWLMRKMQEARQRVSFVNRASHELRSPLTNIALNADLLEDELSGDGERRLGVIREEVGRLGRLIDNVLTFSKQGEEEGELVREEIELGDVVEEVVGVFRAGLERRGMEVSVSGEGRAMGDRDAVSQVVGNLVSNVEKYAPEGKILRIVLKDGMVRVEDEGVGIPEGAEERVFRAFGRVGDEASVGASGTGLGLAISRDLARGMGGDLVLVRDGRKRGAAFELRLEGGTAKEAK